MLKRSPGLPAILLVLIILGCGGSDKPTSSNGTVKEDPLFAADIQPILNASCARSGCHNSTASAGMNLSSGQAYANIVNVASSEVPSRKRVLPNDAENSYLVMKLEGRQTSGGRMPLGGGSLGSTQIQLIKNWINQGAKNN